MSAHAVKQKTTGENEQDKPRIRIKLRAYDHKIIDQSASNIIEAVTRSGASVKGPIPLPTEKKKYTVLRSTFVHKNAQDQYEMRIHKRIIDIIDGRFKVLSKTKNQLAVFRFIECLFKL